MNFFEKIQKKIFWIFLNFFWKKVVASLKLISSPIFVQIPKVQYIWIEEIVLYSTVPYFPNLDLYRRKTTPKREIFLFKKNSKKKKWKNFWKKFEKKLFKKIFIKIFFSKKIFRNFCLEKIRKKIFAKKFSKKSKNSEKFLCTKKLIFFVHSFDTQNKFNIFCARFHTQNKLNIFCVYTK